MPDDFNNKFSDAMNNIELVRGELYQIAMAHRVIGNNDAADKLFKLTYRLVEASRFVAEGKDAVISNIVRASEEATTNMVRATIAVAALGSE